MNWTWVMVFSGISIFVMFIIKCVISEHLDNAPLKAVEAKKIADKLRKQNWEVSVKRAISVLKERIKKEAYNQKYVACYNIAEPIREIVEFPTEEEYDALIDEVDRYFKNKGYSVRFVSGSDYHVINCYVSWDNAKSLETTKLVLDPSRINGF